MKKVFSSSMLLVYMIIMTCLCESIEEIVNPIKKNHEVCYAFRSLWGHLCVCHVYASKIA